MFISEGKNHCFDLQLDIHPYLKFMEMEACLLSGSPHDKQEIWSQHKRNSFLINSKEAFIIPKNMAKINMEKVTFIKRRSSHG